MSERVSLEGHRSERLAARRRRSRRLLLIALGILFFIVVGAVFYGLSRPEVRISNVTVYGASQSLAAIATTAMQGSYLGIPRNSTFFVPETRIRSLIRTTYPDIAAVSIFRNGFTGLSIKVDYRVPIARWCGFSYATTSPEDALLKEVTPLTQNTCYLFDADSFVYATATEPFLTTTETASSSPVVTGVNPDQTLTPFILFDSFQSSSALPIGSTLTNAPALPAVFAFARQLRTFGASVGAIVIRGDEVDFFLVSPANDSISTSRITYLLGDEQNAFTALASAQADFNFTDGSVSYLDLRFPGKIYLKKVGSH
ncbi:MAG TPA: hypothetical protein VMV38_00960 [Candidatus Paceibacterota bacterium]|nr:hypothetical protein [Candidatus Paceibacterota bacterium]